MRTREVIIGNIKVGGDNPVRIQGMLKSSFDNPANLLSEAQRLKAAGAEMIRCAVPEEKDAKAVYSLLKEVGVPLIADCHFQSRTSLSALEAGFDKIRLNPGNTPADGVMSSVSAAKEMNKAVRIGFNSGSCRAKTPIELAMLALEWDDRLKQSGFMNFVVSMKSSSVTGTVEANRYFSLHSDTPLHIGVTAAGPEKAGILKSSVALGALLLDGVGDTVRVSLTGDSEQEIKVAAQIAAVSKGINKGLEIISCPTCSRSRIDVRRLVDAFEKEITEIERKKNVKVALMGCEVNGPGEAASSDIGICGTKNGGLFFKKGKIVSKLKRDEMIKVLKEEMDKL